MENGKISALQMSMLLYPAIIATAILSVPSYIAQFAGNDLWLSPIIASSAGFLTVFIAVKLHTHYPDKTVIQFSEDILGLIPGKLISLLILLFYIEITGNIARNYSEFIVSSFLIETPQIVVIGSMMFLCAWCVYGGLEVLARSAQFLFPLFVIPFIFSIILLAKDFQIENIQPILENGIMPSIKGAIGPSGWFAEIFLISFLLPFLIDKKKGKTYGMFTVLLVMLTLVTVNLITLFILGVATPNKIYPLMNVIRYAGVGSFFENMEAIVMAVWITGAFVKLSIFYYVTTLGTAQWLNLSSNRSVVWPLGIIMVQFAYWGIPNTMALSRSDMTTFPIYSLITQLMIPLFLLIIATLKNKGKERKVVKP